MFGVGGAGQVGGIESQGWTGETLVPQRFTVAKTCRVPQPRVIEPADIITRADAPHTNFCSLIMLIVVKI